MPYTGVFPIENTLDHTGPMTANVADNALLLEVLAGPDGLDHRQVNVKTAQYTNALTGDARGMKIAVVKEGFGLPNSEADVDALVKQGRGHRSGTWAPRSTRCRSRCTWPDSPSGRRSPSRARPCR